MSFNVVTTRQNQIIIDQAALTSIQTDLARRIADLERLKAAFEIVAKVNEPEKFAAAAMALCNLAAERWKAERASVGFLKGRYVRLMALSHTEKFTRQMRLVQDIEASMEECLDQDVEILFPPPADAAYVSRSSETLASRHGPNAICSLPLRRHGEVVAVLTLERKADKGFGLDEVETLRLTTDLVTSRLVDLYEHDRWIGAKAARMLRKGLSFAVGPKHTWIKAAVIAVAAFVLFAVLVKGERRVEAPFAFEAIQKNSLSAPFDGYIKSVNASAGDSVLSRDSIRKLQQAATPAPGLPSPLDAAGVDGILATLDTEELENQLLSAKMELQSATKQRDKARAENKTGDMLVYEANMGKAQAELDLLQSRIRQATIMSPIDGVVFSGDLKQKIGTKVQTGDVLFEIGQPQELRAELSVPADDINDVQVGQMGELATASYPGNHIKFRVEQIVPVAEVNKEKSVFKVRVKIEGGQLENWMRPGMDGVAKVDVGEETYAWIWSRRLINWVRMKLWF